MTNQPVKGPYMIGDREFRETLGFGFYGYPILTTDGQEIAFGESDIPTAQLLADSWEMLKELREQWESNHFEHCRRDWPHEHICYWPMPAVLANHEREA